MNWSRPKLANCESADAFSEGLLRAVRSRDAAKARAGRARWVMLPDGSRVHASKIRTFADYSDACAARGIAV